MHGNHFVGIGACHEQKVSKMPSCLESSSSSYSLAFAVAASGLPPKGGSRDGESSCKSGGGGFGYHMRTASVSAALCSGHR